MVFNRVQLNKGGYYYYHDYYHYGDGYYSETASRGSNHRRNGNGRTPSLSRGESFGTSNRGQTVIEDDEQV